MCLERDVVVFWTQQGFMKKLMETIFSFIKLLDYL